MPFDSLGQGAAVCCSRCQVPFLPRRKDQKYCGETCAKAATRNTTRGPRKIAESADAARIHESRKGRVGRLSHALHETPPAYRAAFLHRLIGEGRGNAELRRLVTVRALLRSWSRDEGTGRLNIAHVLDHFCQEVYGLRSFQVLNPKTILPPVEALCFPAAYYGPEVPPVYEDGALKERPCPWMAWKKSLHHHKEHRKENQTELVQHDFANEISALRVLHPGAKPHYPSLGNLVGWRSIRSRLTYRI